MKVVRRPQWAKEVSDWASPEKWRYDCIEDEWYTFDSLRYWTVRQQGGGSYCVHMRVAPLIKNDTNGTTRRWKMAGSWREATGPDIQMLFRLLLGEA